MSVQTLSLASLRHVITRPITLNALLPKTKTLRSENFGSKSLAPVSIGLKEEPAIFNCYVVFIVM